MKLKPRMGLNAVECRLVKEFDSAGVVIPRNIVHDLEWGTAGKIEVDVAERPFADR